MVPRQKPRNPPGGEDSTTQRNKPENLSSNLTTEVGVELIRRVVRQAHRCQESLVWQNSFKV